MATFVRVEGLAEVTAALRALPPELASNRGGPIRRSLARAAALIRDDAARRAPRRTGNLAIQVYMFRDRNPRASTGAAERYIIGVRSGQGQRTYRVRTRGKFAGRSQRRFSRDAYYWRFVEFGTEKMTARPFLRPAFEANKEAAVTEFVDAMRTSVENATARARAKGRVKR